MGSNSLVLLSMGFSEAWIGGEELAFKIPKDSQRLHYQKAWITLDNIALIKKSQDFLGNPDPMYCPSILTGMTIIF